MESLGELIKRTLKEKGIKEIFVAQKMNVSKQVINQLDKRKNFDIAFLQELKDATGLDFTGHLFPKNYPLSNQEPPQLNENTNEYPKKVGTTLSITFEIPTDAYKDISAFMQSIDQVANNYGITIL